MHFKSLIVAPFVFLFQLVSILAYPFVKLYYYLGDVFLFRFLLPRCYIYNQNVEDPRMDIKELELKREDHVLTIASAGCNSFDYLIEGARVTSADMNPHQIALVQLKVATAVTQSYDVFFRIFGAGDTSKLRSVWWDKSTGLRDSEGINAFSREFWDTQLPKSGLHWWYKGLWDRHHFYYTGAGGLVARGLQVMLSLSGLLTTCKNSLNGIPPADDIASKKIATSVRILSFMVRVLRPIVMALQGVPNRQLELALSAVPDYVEVCLHRVLKCIVYGTLQPLPRDSPRPRDLPTGNYFYHAFLFGRYRDEFSCPRYLQREHFPALKQAFLKGRFHLFSGTLEDAAKQAIATGKGITVYSFLDSMDWMPREETTRMLSVVFSAASRKVPHARVFWRSGSPSFNIPALLYTNPRLVNDSMDRVGTYLSTWIGTLPTAPIISDSDHGAARHSVVSEMIKPIAEERGKVRSKEQGKMKRALSKVSRGLRIATFPISSKITKTRFAPKVGALIKSQQEEYDTFHESTLVAKPLLLEYVRAAIIRFSGDNHNSRVKWVDVGGGALRSLKLLGQDFIRRYIEKIWILDTTFTLRPQAEALIQQLGLEDLVSLVEVDLTTTMPKSIITSLPRESVQVVTMSYALSSIKPACLERVIEWLAPGGVIGVGDFTVSKQDTIKDNVAKWWYGKDGMDLDPQVRAALTNHKSLGSPMATQWTQRHYGMPFVVPHHYVQIAFRT